MKQKRESKPVDVVYCEWIDSETTYGWNKVIALDNTVCKIRSVGVLVKEDKRNITLSTSHSRNDSVIDPITIPKVAVTYLKRMKV